MSVPLYRQAIRQNRGLGLSNLSHRNDCVQLMNKNQDSAEEVYGFEAAARTATSTSALLQLKLVAQLRQEVLRVYRLF